MVCTGFEGMLKSIKNYPVIMPGENREGATLDGSGTIATAVTQPGLV